MNDNEKYIEEFMKDIRFDDAPDKKHRDALQKQLLETFPKHRLQPTASSVQIWRIIMNNRITKFATAAAIIIAVLFGLNIVGNGGSVALAEVLENIMDISAYSYWVRTTAADASDYTEFRILASKDHGQRADAYIPDEISGELKLFALTYTVLSERTMISIVPGEKVYAQINLTDELWEHVQKENCNPGFFVGEFIKHPLTELGLGGIDGVEVVGFESMDLEITEGAGRSVARIWVDVETRLPVKIEAETFDQDGSVISKMTTDGFEWDVQVAPSDFDVVIPDDYNTMGKLEFSADEKSVIQGLRFFAEITGGRYPETLAVKQLTLSNQISQSIYSGAGQLYAGWSEKEIMNEVGQGCMNLEFTVVFYGMMVSQNKAAAYYGDKVTTEHPDAVLMRWRQDNGLFKVIFGDLTIEEVTENELAQLENLTLE